MLFTTPTAAGPHAERNGRFVGSATDEVCGSFDSVTQEEVDSSGTAEPYVVTPASNVHYVFYLMMLRWILNNKSLEQKLILP